MNRVDVAHRILEVTSGRTYLEIGVSTGESLLPMRVRRKFAVDPHFLIPWWKKWRHFRNLFSRTDWFSMTSDEFFSRHADRLRACGLDLALVDGLHTYDQALRDVENTVRFLNPNGVVLMHDCNPATAEQMSGCGDVWRAVIHLRAARRDLSVFVLDTDYGLGIVTRGGSSAAAPPVRIEEIRAMPYGEFARRRMSLLDLRPLSALDRFLSELRARCADTEAAARGSP